MPDSAAKSKLLGARYARIEKRLLPFLRPLINDALARGVHPPRRDPDLEEAQNFLFMLTKDDPLRKEIDAYLDEKAAGRTIAPYHGVQMGWYPDHCLKGAVSSLANMLWSVYINRLTSILRPGMTEWGDGRVVTAPHLQFYGDPACIDSDMLPIGLDIREIDDHFWHTVLTADDVRSALRAYKATLPAGRIIDEDLALILDDFLTDVAQSSQTD
jgi:hypothetical protein